MSGDVIELLPDKTNDDNFVAYEQYADVVDYRRENLKRYVRSNGGVTTVSVKLGYTTPSFLVQMIGPSPIRPITEKSARKFETLLDLLPGSLDNPVKNCKHIAMPSVKVPSRLKSDVHPFTGVHYKPETEENDMMTPKDALQITTVMKLVHELCTENGIDITVPKFITLVQQAVLISTSNDGKISKEDLTPLIDLIK